MRTRRKNPRYPNKPALAEVHARSRFPDDPNARLTNDQLADVLGVCRLSPVIWRRERRGPRYFSPPDARIVIYRWQDVAEWLESGPKSTARASIKATAGEAAPELNGPPPGGSTHGSGPEEHRASNAERNGTRTSAGGKSASAEAEVLS